jgi:hypothetical protein
MIVPVVQCHRFDVDAAAVDAAAVDVAAVDVAVVDVAAVDVAAVDVAAVDVAAVDAAAEDAAVVDAVELVVAEAVVEVAKAVVISFELDVVAAAGSSFAYKCWYSAACRPVRPSVGIATTLVAARAIAT